MLLMPFQAAIGGTSALTPVRRTDELEKLLGRYWSRFRSRLRAFAEASGRHADLMQSFPAAAIEIICRHTGDGSRAEALDLVARGAPLTLVAAALDLPCWMRKLPPECFSQPLPEERAPVLYDAELGARLLNTLPMTAMRPDRWLQSVLSAAYLGGGDFALWIGAQRIFKSRRVSKLPLLPLALYQSFSAHPQLPASRLIQRPWDARMSLGRASHMARSWLLRVLQDHCIETGQTNAWTRTRQANGLDIVPLDRSVEIVAEGVAMQSCVASYAAYVAFGECRLYSIRSQGQRLATMEVRLCEASGQPHINQIKGPCNAPPVDAAMAAAEQWLDDRVAEGRVTQAFRERRHSEALFRRHVWEPYAASMKFAVDPAPSAAAVLSALRDLMFIERL